MRARDGFGVLVPLRRTTAVFAIALFALGAAELAHAAPLVVYIPAGFPSVCAQDLNANRPLCPSGVTRQADFCAAGLTALPQHAARFGVGTCGAPTPGAAGTDPAAPELVLLIDDRELENPLRDLIAPAVSTSGGSAAVTRTAGIFRNESGSIVRDLIIIGEGAGRVSEPGSSSGGGADGGGDSRVVVADVPSTRTSDDEAGPVTSEDGGSGRGASTEATPDTSSDVDRGEGQSPGSETQARDRTPPDRSQVRPCEVRGREIKRPNWVSVAVWDDAVQAWNARNFGVIVYAGKSPERTDIVLRVTDTQISGYAEQIEDPSALPASVRSLAGVIIALHRDYNAAMLRAFKAGTPASEADLAYRARIPAAQRNLLPVTLIAASATGGFVRC